MSEGGAGAARRRGQAHHADAAADDAVAVPAAQARLCKAKGGASEKAGALAPLRIKAGKTHASATRPRTARAAAGGRRSASCGRGGGAREREPRRRRRGRSTAGGDALVPLNGDPIDPVWGGRKGEVSDVARGAAWQARFRMRRGLLLEREGGGRLPLLRAAQDQVVERVADAVVCEEGDVVSNALASTACGYVQGFASALCP